MRYPSIIRRIVLAALLLLSAPCLVESPGAAYDPLAVPSMQRPAALDLAFTDQARKRELPVRVYLPAGTSPAPVVLFSHGLGGSREGSAFLGTRWANRGYVCVFLQHPGSDVSLWKGKPAAEILPALQKALTLQNLLLRVKDVPAVLNQLAAWNKQSGHPLAGRLDLSRIGMSGHSFGAITTQAVSGQTLPNGKALFTDPRIKAAIIFSPSSPKTGTPQQAFSGVKIPWMLMTGTKDVVPLLGGADVKSRLAVFPALPPGDKYELVLDRAEHSVFTDRSLPTDTQRRNPNHHRVILALSTAFWDAYLRGEPAAKAWLQGDGPKSLLEKNDRWQRK